MSTVELQYDPSLPHQVAAIDAVVDLFEGALGDASSVVLNTGGTGMLDLVELGFANPVPDNEAAFEASLLERLRVVQRRGGIEPAERLDGRHFTVEMETGTGKTYVYLRTIFELHRRYGLTKFVITVPTVAIREGVLASLRSIGPHLERRYTEPLDFGVYDAKRLSRVRQFATASTLQVLVMNIQAFQKDLGAEDRTGKANIINRPHDSMAGRRPIESIQAVRPVVIVDEPQAFESDAARQALDRLNPLCTLRYSATPKRPYNLVHRLGPVDAFQQGLVKGIEVDGVLADTSFNVAHVRLLAVDAEKNRAQVEINVGIGDAARRGKVWVTRGDDLLVRSKGRDEYRDGYLVDDILFEPGHEALELTSGTSIGLGAFSGPEVDAVQRLQVRNTIKHHLDRDLRLRSKGIKVLSLFFLDAVADYRRYAPDGSDSLGPIGEVFEEELAALLGKPRYSGLVAVEDIPRMHDGYFSQDNAGRARDSRGDSENDRSAYEKIMRGKEQLLSLDEPLRFIFTHSALREGWDNPNIFQVCTLTHARSAITRRQQIGRGLRLPVDQHGARVHDRAIARLTVVANESYDDFARGLQTDYEREAGQNWGVVERAAFSSVLRLGDDAAAVLGPERSADVWEHLRVEGVLDGQGKLTPGFRPDDESFVLPMPPDLASARDGVLTVLERYARPLVRDVRARERVRFRKAVTLDEGFQQLWQDVARRTRYRVSVDSDRLVREAADAIREMEGVPRPLVRAERAQLGIDATGVHAGIAVGGAVERVAAPRELPDVLGHLQNATDLTRATLGRVLRECGRLRDLEDNPHAFLVEVTRIIRRVLGAQLVEGIEYEQVDGAIWEMRRLEPDDEQEIIRYGDRLYTLQNEGKSPYSSVEWESSVERRFAARLDHDERVQFFVKLPAWFTVDTPLGPYNPDWAIAWDDGTGRYIHLVRETKSTHEELERRGNENAKIACARRHFAALALDYRVTTDFDELAATLA